MATPSELARNRVAILSRHRPDSPELIDARRQLAAAKIETAIRQATAAGPPLTAEQVNHLATLLMSGGAA